MIAQYGIVLNVKHGMANKWSSILEKRMLRISLSKERVMDRYAF